MLDDVIQGAVEEYREAAGDEWVEDPSVVF